MSGDVQGIFAVSCSACDNIGDDCASIADTIAISNAVEQWKRSK